jgi:hypothetical protein
VGKSKRIIGHFPFIISHFANRFDRNSAEANDFLKNDQMRNVKWKMTNDSYGVLESATSLHVQASQSLIQSSTLCFRLLRVSRRHRHRQLSNQ